MKAITLEDLTPLELETLEFNLAVVGCDEAETQFIHNHLYRDEDGVAYYLVSASSRKFHLYT